MVTTYLNLLLDVIKNTITSVFLTVFIPNKIIYAKKKIHGRKKDICTLYA